MTPIPPKAVLFLMQSGWPVDLVFPITVASMNGLRAPVAAGMNQRLGDQSYFRAITLLREIQKSGAVGMRIQQQGEQETTVMLFHREGVPPEIKTTLEELTTLLDIAPELVRLEPFFMPVYRGARRGPTLLTAGLGLYAVLARFGPGAGFRRLSPRRATQFRRPPG